MITLALDNREIEFDPDFERFGGSAATCVSETGTRCGELTEFRDAFAALVAGGAPRLRAIAHQFFRCEADRDDAIQDALVLALQHRDSFAGKASLGTWLHRIVVNCCLMKLRSRTRRRTSSFDELRFDDCPPAACQADVEDDCSHERLSRDELREQVRACIRQLPPQHREIIQLRDIEEFDTEQTAELLGISRVAVKTRLHRARRALRQLLEPVLDDE